MRLTGLRDRVEVVERVDRVDAESLPGDEAGRSYGCDWRVWVYGSWTGRRVCSFNLVEDDIGGATACRDSAARFVAPIVGTVAVRFGLGRGLGV